MLGILDCISTVDLDALSYRISISPKLMTPSPVGRGVTMTDDDDLLQNFSTKSKEIQTRAPLRLLALSAFTTEAAPPARTTR